MADEPLKHSEVDERECDVRKSASTLLDCKERSKQLYEMKYTDGSYIGEYENGKRHGHGIFEWLIGDIYEGGWKDDHRQALPFRLLLNIVYKLCMIL